MENKDKQVSRQELAAFGVGLVVTIASTLLTTMVNPIPFPFNLLISLGLGATAGYGALKVLDPRTDQDVLEAQTDAEYRKMLQEMTGVAMQIGEASQSLRPISLGVSGGLDRIARMSEMILDRYKKRRRDFSGASATLLILQRFEEILDHYLKVKRGELFMDEVEKANEIEETETHIIPMFEIALDSLGMKLDAGETLDKAISKGTLESMLQSLNLIESLSDQIGSPSEKGDLQ